MTTEEVASLKEMAWRMEHMDAELVELRKDVRNLQFLRLDVYQSDQRKVQGDIAAAVAVADGAKKLVWAVLGLFLASVFMALVVFTSRLVTA